MSKQTKELNYTRLPPLSKENVEALTQLYAELDPPEAVSHHRRNGVNIQNNLSVYKNTKWFWWSRKQRQLFKDNYLPAFTSKALVGYFIEFPAKRGFLDRMEAWVDASSAGVIIAYALHDNQHIWLDDKKVVLSKGEGIAFSLRRVHEVKPSKTRAVWANLMVTELALQQYLDG